MSNSDYSSDFNSEYVTDEDRDDDIENDDITEEDGDNETEEDNEDDRDSEISTQVIDIDKMIAAIFISMLLVINNRCNRYDVIVVGNSFNSKLSYYHLKRLNKKVLYVSSSKNTVLWNNHSIYHYDVSNISDEVTMTSLSNEELQMIGNVSQLSYAQEWITRRKIRIDDIMNIEGDMLTSIMRLSSKMFLVETNRGCVISSKIITDFSCSLQLNEEERLHNIIYPSEKTMIIKNNKMIGRDDVRSPFFGLIPCRSSRHDNLLCLSSLHIPLNSDPFLTILLMTQDFIT